MGGDDGEEWNLDKHAFIQAQQEQVSAWRNRLNDLRSSSDHARWRDREDYNQRVAELHFKLKEVEQKVIELKLASPSKADTVGRQIESAWSDLQSSFESFARTFGDTVDVATADPGKQSGTPGA